MSRDHEVSELELQAYLDGELPLERRIEVEAHLAEHPQAAAVLSQLKAIHHGLHHHYDALLEQPIPDAMAAQLAAINANTSPNTTAPGRSISRIFFPRGYPSAVAASWLLLGSLIGTLLGSLLVAPMTVQVGSHTDTPAQVAGADSLQNDLVQPATFAHTLFTPERQYAVEIPGTHQQQLAAWLSERMHWQIRIPDLTEQGLQLVGGRLLPSTNRMAAQFMYETQDGQRMTLYIRRVNSQDQSLSFHFEEKDGLAVFYWLSSPLGYALTGQMDHAQMLTVVETIHRQLKHR